MLASKGVTAWQRALASLAVPQPPVREPAPRPGSPARAPGPGSRRADQRPGRRGPRRNRHRPALAAGPASRLLASTPEADWNTTLRALDDAQAAYDKAREHHPGQLTGQQKARIRRLVTDLPGIWNDPATPARERKRITRLLLTDVTVTRTSDTITAHIRLAGGQQHTLTLPAPRPGWAIRQTPPQVITAIDELLHHHTHAQIAAILNQRGLASGEGRPFHPLIIRNIRDNYQLRSREQRLRDAGM